MLFYVRTGFISDDVYSNPIEGVIRVEADNALAFLITLFNS